MHFEAFYFFSYDCEHACYPQVSSGELGYFFAPPVAGRVRMLYAGFWILDVPAVWPLK